VISCKVNHSNHICNMGLLFRIMVFFGYSLIEVSSNTKGNLTSRPMIGPSQVHYIKLPPQSYTLKCNKEGQCRYESILPRSIARQFGKTKKDPTEETRSKVGRRIHGDDSNFRQYKKKKAYREALRKKKNARKVEKKEMLIETTRRRKLSRPYMKSNLNFVSNAKPSLLKWREVRVISAPIAKPNTTKGQRKSYRSEGRYFPPLPLIPSSLSSPIHHVASPLTGHPNTLHYFSFPTRVEPIIYQNP